MNKLNKLFAILFAVLGVGNLSAQTDVTDTYLTNAGFDDESGWITGNIGQTTVNATTGWTSSSSGDTWYYGGAVNYGSSFTVNNVTPPATNPDGVAEGGALGLSAGWGCTVAYKQEVTLKAGVYILSYKAYNANTAATQAYNFIGFTTSSTSYYGKITNFTANAWVEEEITFGLTSETTGTISVGLGAVSDGSGANAKLFIDGITLTYKTFDDVSAENPVDVTSAIVNPSFETGDMTGWTYTTSSDTGVRENSNSTYTTSGVDGKYLFNTWWKGVPITQTVTNLPNGIYQLNVLVASGDGGTSTPDIYLLANGEHSDVYTISDGINSVFHDVSYEFKVLNGQATIGVVGGNDDGSYNEGGHWWYKADNFRLTYKGADITLELEALETNLATAKAIDQTTIPSSVAVKLTEAISAAEDVEQALNPIKAANVELIAAINLANEAVAPYASLKELISLCETYATENYSLVGTDDVRTTFTSAIATAKTDADDAASASDLNAAYNALENARRAYIVAAIPTAGNSFDMTFKMTNPQVTSASGWTNGGTATNQQYTGAPDNTYLDFYQVTRDMFQTLSDLPNGSYSIKAATRGHASVSVGYIYVKNGDNKITQDIHKVGNSGNDLGNGWGWTTTNSVSVVDGQLTIGFYGECGSGQWVGADNFTLYRTFDVTGVQAGLADLKSEAQAIATASEPMDAAVEATLNSTIQATDATVTDPVALDNMINALNTAIADAEASIADYVRLQKYIDMTAAFADVTAYQAKYDNGQYSSEDVETIRRELNVTRFNAASAVFTNNIEVTGWAGTMGDKTTSGQHWDGTTDGDEATKYYDNNSWNGTAHSTTTSIKLPTGSYVLKAALRSNENTTLKLTVLDNVVDVEGKGDEGYGIDTNGQANFSAEGTYANNNIGRGWEWEFVKFQLAEETEVTLTVECDYNEVYGWASFSDITLWMDDATYVTVYGKELDAPLAEAKALVNTKPMGTNENTALQEAIELGEGAISTPAELNAAVDALKSAVANANAWLAAYNEAKAPLVAALERFETDYNDAENGALDHMNKNRWATAIEKAQAAAVAKDATDSYAGFADATAALVDALDAATVSVNEYASLKSAITEATAVSESEVNWGDAPFQRPESAQEGLNTAISAAESGYNAAEADGEEVTALIDAMAVTLNAPQDAYCITVATDGHAYVDCPVVASLGSITDNNPTGYGLAAKKENEDLLAQLYTFTQVEGNKYRISVTVDGVTVYLTYGVLNDSQAGHRNWQIQGNTDIAKAGEFEVVASTTTEGVFRLRNTVTGTFLDCQDGGSIYTDDNITKDEFALTSATGSADINISADAKLGTCVLMFDAQLPDGLTAYVPESYDNGTTVLTLKMVTGGVLPAYTPCLLYAEGGYEGTLTGIVTMNGYADKVTGDDGLLYGAIEPQEITEGYILQKHDGEEVAKFYSVDGLEEEIPISAGKCWLTLANGVEEALETPAAVAFFFRGGGATKLNAVVMDKTSLDGAIYTLDGKRVNTMQRGEIYIINGQKVMVK